MGWEIEVGFKGVKSLVEVDGLGGKEGEVGKGWIFGNVVGGFLIEEIMEGWVDLGGRSGGWEKKK